MLVDPKGINLYLMWRFIVTPIGIILFLLAIEAAHFEVSTFNQNFFTGIDRT
jgi:hypothetical protein